MTEAVCLIDDDQLFRNGLGDELRALGQAVDEAASAKAGLALMARRTYSTAIVDVLMPDTDGIEAIERIRARWPTMRIIAISGGGRISAEHCLEMAHQIGADAYLRKPLHGRDLMPLIDPDTPSRPI
jgi:DNA-binding response OmpR family regulator